MLESTRKAHKLDENKGGVENGLYWKECNCYHTR